MSYKREADYPQFMKYFISNSRGAGTYIKSTVSEILDYAYIMKYIRGIDMMTVA